METKFYKTMMFFIIIIFSTANALGQIITTGTDTMTVNVYPYYPSATDSIYVSYTYVSTDGCPDYFLVKDSVIGHNIYVSRHPYPFLGRPCTTVITKFTTTVNLGVLQQKTNIYFNGKFIRTIVFQCVPDRKGIVVECGGRLYIEEITSATPTLVGDTAGSTAIIARLFSFANNQIFYSADSIPGKLKTGDKVLFGADIFTKDSVTTDYCRLTGVAKCYQPVYDQPACIMDKTGVIVVCEGQLYIREITATTDTTLNNAGATSTAVQLYTFINNTTIDASGTVLKTLKEGDKVKFKGILMKKDSAYITSCPIVGIAKCYQLIYVQHECVPDRKGIVVLCGGQLYIEENTPYTSPVARLFSFAKSTTGNTAVKAGDKVKFGAVLFAADSVSANGCRIVGIAKCYSLIDTTTLCTFNRKGVVVPGIDGCTGKLFILEDVTGLRFLLNGNYGIYSNAIYSKQLQPGDKVLFSGYLINPKDSTMSILCPYNGVAVCYTPVYPPTTSVLKGYAMAGTKVMMTGYAIQFAKGQQKAVASYAVTNGSFEFKGIPKGEYTVYVIPEKTDSSNYLPTFYINKLFYRNADYVMLSDTATTIRVVLRPFVCKPGTGKIHGNIYYESGTLNDNILAKNGWIYAVNAEVFMMAVNIPVLLLNNENTVVAWTMTDVYGNYAFENITPADYSIQAETGSAAGESTATLDAVNMDITASFTLKSTDNSTNTVNLQVPVIGLYPNPSTDKIMIVLREKQMVSLYNTMGQLLKQEQINAGSSELDISRLGKGIYFVKAGTTVIKLIKE